MKLTVAQLASRIGAELVGAPEQADTPITAVGPIETAGENEVTFIRDSKQFETVAVAAAEEKRQAYLQKCRAGAVIVGKRIDNLTRPQLIVESVDTAIIEALNLFAPKLKAVSEGIDPTAKIGENVKIAEGVFVGPNVVIADEVEIGGDTFIAGGCKIGQNSRIGKNCRLDGNVVVYHNCTIGNNVIIQANSTIGSTGFGYFLINNAHKLIPHNGGVVIEDFVEIGANCCIDRAKLGNTIIGAGTKIDNLVQIAHNVVIGKCCLIAGQSGISGSCKLGDGVVLAGQVGLADNIEIGDGTIVGAQSGVMADVPAGRQIAWTPAIEKKELWRVIGSVMRLPKLAEQLKQLAKRVKELEAAKDDKI